MSAACIDTLKTKRCAAPFYRRKLAHFDRITAIFSKPLIDGYKALCLSTIIASYFCWGGKQWVYLFKGRRVAVSKRVAAATGGERSLMEGGEAVSTSGGEPGGGRGWCGVAFLTCSSALYRHSTLVVVLLFFFLIFAAFYFAFCCCFFIYVSFLIFFERHGFGIR